MLDEFNSICEISSAVKLVFSIKTANYSIRVKDVIPEFS